MKKAYLLVVTILIVAGCTGRQVKIANDGIVINSFIATPDDVKEFNEVQFELEIENIGGATASDVRAELDVQSIWVGNTAPKTIGNLKPPSRLENTPGDFKIVQWILTPPNLPEGIVVPYTI